MSIRSSPKPRISLVWKSSHDVVINENLYDAFPVLPKLNLHGFPQAPVESQRLPRSTGKKNVSLFSSRRSNVFKPQFEIVPDSKTAADRDDANIEESDDIEVAAAQDADNLFHNMDDEQRREYRELLLQTLPKDLIDKWTQQSSVVEKSEKRSDLENVEEEHHLTTEWMSPITDEDLVVSKDQDDLPIRFDFNGDIVPSDRDVSVLEGLHHHGREAGLAGYTISELCLLLRSTVASQRIAALGVVVAILRRFYEDEIVIRNETSLCHPTTPSDATSSLTAASSSFSIISNEVSLQIWKELVQRCKIHLLLRTTLDTDNPHQICLSLEALFFLVSPPDLFQRLDDFDYEGGHFWNPVDASFGILQKLTGFLLIERLRYLVEVSGSYHVGIRLAALDLLTAIAGHSREMAARIAECPRMLTVLDDFTHRAFEFDHSVLLASLRLLRLLAQSDRDIACAISSLSIPCDLTAILSSPPQLSHAVECVRIFTVLRLYDPDSNLFEILSTLQHDLNLLDPKMQRSVVKLIVQNPGSYSYGVQDFIKPDALPVMLRLLPIAVSSLQFDKSLFAIEIATRWRSFWESCCTSFFEQKKTPHRKVNVDCQLYLFQGLSGDSITDDMYLLVKSFLALRCNALADILSEGYVADLRRIASYYRSCRTAINVTDGYLFASIILVLDWIGDDVVDSGLVLPALSFPGAEPALYDVILSGVCTFNSVHFRDILRVVWLGSLCTDWTLSSLYVASASRLPLPSDWMLSSTLDALQNSGDDFNQVIIPRLQSLLEVWQFLSLIKAALFQALLRVFAFGCEVFLSPAVEPMLRVLSQSCFRDESFSVSLDKSLVSLVASVFAEESFGSSVFASCLMAILARGKTELKLALCGALGASTMSRLSCDSELIPFAACDYLYPPETDSDLLLFYRQVLLENAASKDNWIYIAAVHHTYCSFFDHADHRDVPILEICSFIHENQHQVLMDLLSYEKPPADVKSFFVLENRQIPEDIAAVLRTAIQNDPSIEPIVLGLTSGLCTN